LWDALSEKRIKDKWSGKGRGAHGPKGGVERRIWKFIKGASAGWETACGVFLRLAGSSHRKHIHRHGFDRVARAIPTGRDARSPE
jgi:hypothetical protein